MKGKMKPHTRTQCDGKDCVECGQGDKNVGTGQEDLNNGALEQNEKSENEDRRPSTSEPSSNPQISPEERIDSQNQHINRNGITEEYVASTSILQPSTSKILSSSFSSSASSPFIVPTTRGRRSMAHASSQTAALGSGNQKLDPIHSVINPPHRRGGNMAILSKVPHHTMADREAVPRGGGGIWSNGNNTQLNRSILIVELPAEILVKIMNYMSFNEISQVRLVRIFLKNK